METREYRTVDKSTWRRGEWDDEPDKIQWQDEATKLPCLIVRNQSGALCGYVGVPDSHPWYKKGYSETLPHECNDACSAEHDYHAYGASVGGQIDVHGGLTFSNMCSDSVDESRHICHVPEPGEPDHVWWFGFDCAHSGDESPAYDHRFRYGDEWYKNVAYVKREVTSLAAQLARIAR